MTFRLKDKYLCLYTNEDIRNFIEKFFTIKEGNRCRVRHCVGRKSPFYGNESVYPEYTRFVPINKENIHPELASGLSHFYMYIYNDDVIINGYKIEETLLKEENDKRFREYIQSHYLGVSYVVDIDSPRMYPDIVGNDERHDFFESDVTRQFNEATKLVASSLDNSGFEYNCMFSGNGFYFILESIYSDEIISTKENVKMMKFLLNKVDEELKENNNPIQIKAINQGWNRYYKAPFIFHRNPKYQRISIPLSKKHIGNIDSIWLNRVTNISNIIKINNKDFSLNVGIINEIINSCNWRKIW